MSKSTVQAWLTLSGASVENFAHWAGVPLADLQRWASGDEEPPDDIRQRIEIGLIRIQKVRQQDEARRQAQRKGQGPVIAVATPDGGYGATDGRTVVVSPSRQR